MERLILTCALALLSSLELGSFQERIIIHSPPPPPPQIEQFVSESDAVLVVTIENRRPFKEAQRKFPYMLYRAKIDEVIKWSPLLSLDAEFGFLEIASEADAPQRTNHQPSLLPKERAVIFLSWAEGLQKFQLNSGRFGAFRLEDDKIRPSSEETELSRTWSGKKTDEFLQRIRGARLCSLGTSC